MGCLNRILTWLPSLNPQIWVLAFGRLLSQTGTGFTLFYAPIFFVNQVGLSATAVGIGLGSAQISGILGRILGGSFSDSPVWGRRRTLLLSALISAISSFILASASDFKTVVLGNLFLGLGIGLYWPATEAVVADLSTGDNRNQAFALTRLADNIGLQLGIILGGVVISRTGAYRALFIIDALSFLVFFCVIFLTIKETYKPSKDYSEVQNPTQKWLLALRDRTLLIFVMINIMFTVYISQIHSTIPLYFNQFVNNGFSPGKISYLFAGYITLCVLTQLPIADFLSRWTRPQALMISASFWGIGFILIGLTGIVAENNLLFAILALSLLAIATVSYTPSASALVADLAPESLRGIYLAINAQCWAIGYLIGPPLGGWVLDQTPQVVYNYWLGLAASISVAILILQVLNRIMDSQKINH